MTAVFFVVIAAAVISTFCDYGYSWDEVWQGRWYGQAVLRFITSLGVDRSATHTANFYLYGGTFEVLTEMLTAISPLDPRNTRHLANALTGMIALLGCWRVARYLGGAEVGLWAAVFLIVCAPFYGHMFINGKDIPFAAGYIWSLYYLLRTNENFFDPPLSTRLLLGLCIGLSLGVRIGACLLLFYYFLLAAWRLLDCFRFDFEVWRLERPVLMSILHLLPVLVVSYLLMLVCWPAALLSPINVPLLALSKTSHFNWPATVLWNGQVLWGDQLPWNYIPVSYAVQLPEILTILFLLATLWGITRVFTASRTGDIKRKLGYGLLLIAAFFPPLWAIVTRAVVYDNARHFLFVLPPLACLAALLWVSIIDVTKNRVIWGRWLLSGLMVLLLAIPFGKMLTLHPYEYTYFNLFAGGIPNAAEKFETDYWITSYREASLGLVAHAQGIARAQGIPFSSMRFSVMAVAPSRETVEFVPDNFDVVELNLESRADYLIATTRWEMDKKWPDWPVVYRVERSGMVYAVVKCSPELARLALSQ